MDDEQQKPVDKSPAEPSDPQERREELHVNMMRSIVTEPLLTRVQNGKPDDKFDVIVVLNELYWRGMESAREEVKKRADEWGVSYNPASHYLFGCLTKQQILALAEEARELIRKQGPKGTVIYRIWEDSDVDVSLYRSVCTVKGDAALRSFNATGEDIVWAVLDSGIYGDHRHFKNTSSPLGEYECLKLSEPLQHRDFTPMGKAPLEDKFGHGTHVAGIIAGYWKSSDPDGDLVAGSEERDEQSNNPLPKREKLKCISGVAQRCTLLSLKVIADRTISNGVQQTAGKGKVSWLLLAIQQIQDWNQNGKRILVHGANMSLGYDFDPRWFGCGQSPLCVEVNRLVKCGVSVVVSAGNAGFSSYLTAAGVEQKKYTDLSITDPGNADLAITVGSTHRDMPHTYGVSYFSSRGPTGDGRMKPDMVAPGERIISCAAGKEADKYLPAPDATGPAAAPVLYCEQTGTSMAAPHVSGAIAAFLSVRREFIGQPEVVKQIFMDNTVDLKRERKFQGTGMLDLMKVIQAV
jgi:serine protease AprX